MPDSRDRSFHIVRLLAAACVLLCGSARAQAEEFDLSQFLAPLGRAATLRIEQPAPAAHGTFGVGLQIDYAHELLQRGLACTRAGDTRSFCTDDARTRAGQGAKSG